MLYFHLSIFQQAQAATVLAAMLLLVLAVNALRFVRDIWPVEERQRKSALAPWRCCNDRRWRNYSNPSFRARSSKSAQRDSVPGPPGPLVAFPATPFQMPSPLKLKIG